MEFKSQICTTREQSERLLALGLKAETADMVHYRSASMKEWGLLANPFNRECEHSKNYYPAWSFSRLLEIYLTSEVYRNILFVNKEDSFEYLFRHVEVYIKAGYIDENYLTEDYGTRGLQD